MTEVKDPILESKRTSKYIRFFRIAWIFEVGTVLIAALIHHAEGFSWRLLAGMGAIAAINMVAYAVNDYFDREVDAKHPSGSKRNPLASGEMSLPEARRLIIAAAAAALLLSALVSPWAILTNAIYMVIGLVYVAEPIRLKRRFLLDVASHIFTVMSYSYLFTVIFFYRFTPLDAFFYVNMVVTSLIVQLSQELFDFDHDREFEHNTAIVLGKRGARAVVRIAHAAYFVNTVTAYALGHFPLALFGYVMIFGVRLYSIFNSTHYEKVLALFRLLLLLFTIFLVIRHCAA
ncbi:UbiA family prenyltransferase [bacterium]|nr:UbiA family prenyltransferase [candidate division CSSED10-310 bacterium]